MIDYYSALCFLFNSVEKSVFINRIESINLNKSLNRISYFDIITFKNIPLYSNSAMDGCAINFNSRKYKININKEKFFIIDIIKAGYSVKSYNIDSDYVIEIMTGAKVHNFSAIAKFEDIVFVNNNPFEIIIHRKINFLENIRVIGEDFKISDKCSNRGKVISLADIMSIATFGISNLNVLKNFKVFLVCTGTEIVDSFYLDYDNNFINNSLSNYIITFLKNLGIDVVYCGIIDDCKKSFTKEISKILFEDKQNIIITTGAVSKGKADFIPSVLFEFGVEVIFHGVAIKPGKPILFAKYLGNNYFFCLPGNPISSVIGLRFFVYPFLMYLNGFLLEKPFKAILDADYKVNRKYDLFLKAFTYFYNSNFYVKILDNQQSFKIKSFIDSNSFVFLRVNDISKKGYVLNVYFYNPYKLG